MLPKLMGQDMYGATVFEALLINNEYGREQWIGTGKNEAGILYFYDMESVITHYLDYGQGTNPLYAVEYTDNGTYARKEPGTIFEETKAGLMANAFRAAKAGHDSSR